MSKINGMNSYQYIYSGLFCVSPLESKMLELHLKKPHENPSQSLLRNSRLIYREKKWKSITEKNKNESQTLGAPNDF